MQKEIGDMQKNMLLPCGKCFNRKDQDYVISTGKTFNIKHFINLATDYLGLKTKWQGKGIREKLINLNNKKVLININPKLFRPAEVNILRGNSYLAKKELNWFPNTDLKNLVKIMIDEELKYYKKIN